MTLLIVISGFFLPKGLNWLAVVFFMVVFIIAIGIRINERPWGVFIDEGNRMSLSRFQLVIWTLIILSAFLVIALERVKANEADPLAIALPWQLWALMGISTTSLVGSPLILSQKSKKPPSNEAERRWISQFVSETERTSLTDALRASSRTSAQAAIISKARTAAEPYRIGIRAVNPDPKDAEFSDMFKGEEINNKGLVDMAKLQMFFFTLISALSYVLLLANWIMTKEPSQLTSFPQLSDGLIAILGISHTGYLANKTYDHTETNT